MLVILPTVPVSSVEFGAAKLATRKTGQFFLLRDGDVVSFTAQPSAVRLAQVADPVIASLAARQRG